MSEAPQIALSIIVPCYKVEKYLPRCLDSLVSQTLENIEIICINDGSPDRCIDILRDYERDYPEKVIVIDKNNEGVWKGRWDGIKIARGEYIGFLDSDDYALPTFSESLYTAAKANSADIAVCGFDRVELETGKRLSREMTSERKPFSIDGDPGRLVELNGAPWNKCFRADALKSMYDLNNPPTVLDDLAFHLLAYQQMHGKVIFVPESLVRYMVRSDSIINTVRKEQVASIFSAFLEIKKIYESSRPELISALDAIAFLHLGVSLVFRLSCSAHAKVSQEVSRMTQYLDNNFPSWRKSPYINFSYASSRGGALVKIYIVQMLYKAHLLPAFLAIYRFMIYRLHVDIKW
ncbi:glycosyltransferase family 2 protein [Collinsella intestinalis]|uniref:glycosyltransferase family 2 protein n=1 Tax=Collinsella intestinalis TaxID=147207 RepID=UPI00195628FF|nr:glycosyltransferase family 2 protein [Collinsella intestinalis]MBM6683390.1 glycosyltransferase [Collinsella intestinalis]